MNDFDLFYIFVILTLLAISHLLIFLRKKKRHFQKRNAFFLIFWNALLTIALAAGLFFLAETYYRFFVDTTDSFGLNKITQRWLKRHYHLNNLKARDNIDYQHQIAPGKRRISFVGDSFTAGHGVADVEDRFPNLIRANNPRWEIHVIAANGLETVDELQVISKLDGEGYQFDVLILVYVINDISYLVPETEAVYEKIYAFGDGLGYLGQNSYFLNTLHFRSFASRTPEISSYYDFVKNAYFSPIWERQAAALRHIVQSGRQKGRRVVVVTFPFLHDLSGYAFTDVHQKLDAFWQSLQTPHLDLYPVFLQHAQENLVVNAFDAHPNERANQIAAEAIERFLKEH